MARMRRNKDEFRVKCDEREELVVEIPQPVNVWMVFDRAWERVIGCRRAEGPDLIGTGELVKVRVRRGAGEFFSKGGLIEVRMGPGGVPEFVGPYFRERVSHARWSAGKRREHRLKMEDCGLKIEEPGAGAAAGTGLDESGAQYGAVGDMGACCGTGVKDEEGEDAVV